MKNLPDTSHVARYCSKNRITEDGRISSVAFKLRPADRGKLSVNWLEHCELAARGVPLITVSAKYKRIMNQPSGARIAIIKVGETKSYVNLHSSSNTDLGFIYSPGSDNPSHSQISNLKPDELEISQLIADSISATYEII